MDEYIPRKVVLDELDDIGFFDDEPIQTRNAALRIVNRIPSADVAPVVHGKWIEESVTKNNSMVKCPVCGEYPEKKDQCFTPYCCLCGAKMDL